MPDGTPPVGSIEAVVAAVDRDRRAAEVVADMRVDLAIQAGDNKAALMRTEIALVLMSVVSVKVAIGKPSPEERKIQLVVDFLLDESREVTKKALLEALKAAENPT